MRHAWSAESSPGSPVQDTGQAGASAKKGHKDNEWTGASPTQVENGRNGTVFPGEAHGECNLCV